MKQFICTFFTLLALTANSTQATESTTEKEIKFDQENRWHLAMAHMVAYQPAAIGWERFAQTMGIKPYLPEWKALNSDAKKVKTWPTLKVEGNALQIVDQGHPGLTVEAVFGEGVKVNGRVFISSGKRPLIEEFREFLAAETGNKNTWNAFSLIPEARAKDSRLKVAATTIGTFTLGTVGLVAAVSSFTKNPAAGLPIVLGGGMLTTFATICSGLAGEEYNPFFDNRSYPKRIGICLASPLSWLNKNWNDRLYLKDLTCGSSFLVAEVKSPSGKIEKRTFLHNEEGRLQAVTLTRGGEQPSATLKASEKGNYFERGETYIESYPVNSSKNEGRLTRPKHKKILDEAQSLFRDFTYYFELCEDKVRREELLRTLARRTQRGERAYDAETPASMDKKAE